MMPDESIPETTHQGNIESDLLITNPEIRVIGLEYPIHQHFVHQISEKDKGQYFVSIHRDIHDKQVHFNEISYPHVLLLEELLHNQQPMNDLFHIYEQFLPLEQAKKETLKFLQFAMQQGLLLGFQKK